MRTRESLTWASGFAWLALFLALTCCGLNLAERAQNHLLGVDRPPGSVSLEPLRRHCLRLHVLGSAHDIDVDGALVYARKALEEIARWSRRLP